MASAESFVTPIEGELFAPVRRRNDLRETFVVWPGRLRFDVAWGAGLNLKVLLTVSRTDGSTERLLVDTDPYDVEWNRHRRVTRDFYLVPQAAHLGPVACVRCAFIVHLDQRSLPSQLSYLYVDGSVFEAGRPVRRALTAHGAVPNAYRTSEVDAAILQRDVDWFNRHFESLRLTPKFTHGLVHHPYHPKRYIHNRIDHVIAQQQANPDFARGIRVCVDCIDDGDFIRHLLHAHECGVNVQCVVDSRKMLLTSSPHYARLKRSGIELVGVFCSSRDPLVEVAPDMHTKFILFGDEDVLHGSFNVTFDRWGANWESGMSFSSQGVVRLLENVFQSIRGGVIQRYQIDPLSHFNLLYTFGLHVLPDGRMYRPHQAILSELNRARRSIRLCLFLLGEMRGEYNESVVDALIAAAARGVNLQMLVNGHVARVGDPGQEHTMEEELRRPLVPAIARLRAAGVRVKLAYGRYEQRVPYCPIHGKYAIIDDRVVLDGSFNWYNTSVFSHDVLVIAANENVARTYLWEFEQTAANFNFAP